MTESLAYMLAHISGTFAAAEKAYPDLMEPYTTRLGDARTPDEKLAIMRIGLRETIAQRYPLPESRYIAATEPDAQARLDL